MSEERKSERRGLGRGLSALMADVSLGQAEALSESGNPQRSETSLPIESIKPNPNQPRQSFRPEDLEDLSNSIRSKGVLQPLIVRPTGDDSMYQIVAGERRWRAAQLAQLHELPVIIRDLSDTEVLEVAIIENIQRADLNPVEEASGFQQLMDQFGHTQEQLAGALGKSRSHIANMVRLLGLPQDVLAYVSDGKLSAGHARALITTEDPSALARKVVASGLSVRETEKLAKGPKPATDPRPVSKPSEKDADTRMLEADLSAATGMKVTIDHKPGGESGKVSISYNSLAQLDDLCRVLSAADID